jgi:hypothetical protein
MLSGLYQSEQVTLKTVFVVPFEGFIEQVPLEGLGFI